MDGIIFDVDGTLWDSTEIVAQSWNQAIMENTENSSDLTGSSIKYLFGKTMDVICAELFPTLKKDEQTRLGKLCFEYENELLRKKPGTLYEGVEKTLQTLSETYPLYIVSNCQCGYVEILLETTGLSHYITDHLCYGETLLPKSQTIRMLMERNRLNEVLYVGDTIGDYQACKEAGIPFIYAEYGFGEVPQAETKITAISELLTYL